MVQKIPGFIMELPMRPGGLLEQLLGKLTGELPKTDPEPSHRAKTKEEAPVMYQVTEVLENHLHTVDKLTDHLMQMCVSGTEMVKAITDGREMTAQEKWWAAMTEALLIITGLKFGTVLKLIDSLRGVCQGGIKPPDLFILEEMVERLAPEVARGCGCPKCSKICEVLDALFKAKQALLPLRCPNCGRGDTVFPIPTKIENMDLWAWACGCGWKGPSDLLNPELVEKQICCQCRHMLGPDLHSRLECSLADGQEAPKVVQADYHCQFEVSRWEPADPEVAGWTRDAQDKEEAAEPGGEDEIEQARRQVGQNPPEDTSTPSVPADSADGEAD